jgi:hypothetical protein
VLQQNGLWSLTIAKAFDPEADAVILEGGTAETLKAVPSGSLKLIHGALRLKWCITDRIPDTVSSFTGRFRRANVDLICSTLKQRSMVVKTNPSRKGAPDARSFLE